MSSQNVDWSRRRWFRTGQGAVLERAVMRLPAGVRPIGAPGPLALQCQVSTPDGLMGLFLLARELGVGLCHVTATPLTRTQIRYEYAADYPGASNIEAWLAPGQWSRGAEPGHETEFAASKRLALVLTADGAIENWGHFGLDGPPLPSGRAGQRIARAFDIAHSQLPCAVFNIEALRPAVGAPHLATFLRGSAGRLGIILRLSGVSQSQSEFPRVASDFQALPLGVRPTQAHGLTESETSATLQEGDQALIRCFDPESLFQP